MIIITMFTIEVPARRPVFPEIHQRLRQWEGLGGRFAFRIAKLLIRKNKKN